MRENASAFASATHDLSAILDHQEHQPVDGCFTPDGRQLLVIDGYAVRVWDLESHAVSNTFKPLGLEDDLAAAERNHGSQSPLACLDVSSDGTYCCIGTANGQIHTWNLELNRKHELSINLGERIATVDFHPTQPILAVGTITGVIRIIDIPNDSLLETEFSQEGTIRSMEFAPTGESLATCGDNWEVRIWNWQTGEQRGPSFTHGAPVLFVCWSPDAGKVLAGDMLRHLREWDVQSHKGEILDVELPSFAMCAAYTKDGRRFALGLNNGQCGVWDRASLRRELQYLRLTKEPYWIAFRPGAEEQLVTPGLRETRIWNLSPAATVADSGGDVFFTEGMTAVKVHSIQPWMAVGTLKGRVRIFNTETLELVGTEIQFDEPVSSISFDSSYERIVVGSFRGSVQLFSYSDGKWTPTFGRSKLPGAVMESISLPSDEVVCASFDGSVHFINVHNGEPSRDSIDHPNTMRLSVTRDFEKLLIGGRTGKFQILDLNSMEPLLAQIDAFGDMLGIDLSRDGKYFAAGFVDGRAVVWNAETGEQLYTPIRHSDAVRNVQFTNDGKFLITGCMDGGIRLWHTQSGRRIGPLRSTHSQTMGTTGFANRDASIVALDFNPPIKCYNWKLHSPRTIVDSQLSSFAESRTGMRQDAEGGLLVLPANEWTPWESAP